MTRLFARAAAWAALCVCLTAPALAQDYPQRPIRLVAPFPAGGAADMLAHAIAGELTKSLGQPVTVENRSGSGGNVGADVVAKAPPDGYTLLMASAGILTANQFLYSKMPFDAERDFVAVSAVADMPMMIVVNAKIEARSLAELIALARSSPAKLSFGSAGIGTTAHLGLALLMHDANIDLAHVPYRGAAPAVAALLSGQVDGVVDNPPNVLTQIKAGKLRALAVAAPRRLAVLPSVPTTAEAGLGKYQTSSWFGVVAPARTPAAIVARLQRDIAAALKQPAIRERIEASGARPLGSTPEEFANLIRFDRAKWGGLIKTAGIKAD